MGNPLFDAIGNIGNNIGQGLQTLGNNLGGLWGGGSSGIPQTSNSVYMPTIQQSLQNNPTANAVSYLSTGATIPNTIAYNTSQGTTGHIPPGNWTVSQPNVTIQAQNSIPQNFTAYRMRTLANPNWTPPTLWGSQGFSSEADYNQWAAANPSQAKAAKDEWNNWQLQLPDYQAMASYLNNAPTADQARTQIQGWVDDAYGRINANTQNWYNTARADLPTEQQIRNYYGERPADIDFMGIADNQANTYRRDLNYANQAANRHAQELMGARGLSGSGMQNAMTAANQQATGRSYGDMLAQLQQQATSNMLSQRGQNIGWQANLGSALTAGQAAYSALDQLAMQATSQALTQLESMGIQATPQWAQYLYNNYMGQLGLTTSFDDWVNTQAVAQ